MRKLIIFGLTFLCCQYIYGQSTATFDFDTAGQLSSEFNQGGSATNITQSTTTGIDGTGAINITNVSTNEVFVTKQGYSNGGVGSVYSFTTYFKSVWNSGYGGIGFTTDANATYQSFAYATNSIGISVHGGGYIFNSGTSTDSDSWNSSTWDLLNNGSPDDWYQVVFTVEQKAGNVFDLTCEVYPANEDGSLIDGNVPPIPDATQTASFTNANMAGASVIYAYFGFGGTRISDFDNYEIDLQGSSIIQAGSPVVIGDAVLSSGDIDLSGEVTDDRGSSVTDRGFVYSTLDTLPETGTATVMQVGTGSGTFSDQLSGPANGTYYVRAYATNSNGTSYGETRSVTVGTLPVEFTEFTVKETEKREAYLNWATAAEINNKQFEIERSVDGRSFEIIATIEGQGNSSERTTYSFLDVDIPASSRVVYYKLKQLDFDDNFSYSKTRVINFDNQLQFQAFPNPVEDYLTLSFAEQVGKVSIIISKPDGSYIYNEAITSDGETANHTLDMNGYPSGLYVVSLISNSRMYSTKIFKK